LCVKDDEVFEVWVHSCIDGALQGLRAEQGLKPSTFG
jgi:hypothetical protein